LEKLGFPVIEVEPGHYVEIAAGIRVWMYESFTKNPLVADAQVPNVIDSAIVVENDNWAILNTNDNTPGDTACRQLREQFGKFDLAMLPYSGASEYPSCFQNLTFEEKQLSGERKIARYLDVLERNVRILEPKLVLPFAGQYILGGKMVYKNRCLGIPPVERAVERITKLGHIARNPQEGDVIDIVTCNIESPLPPYSGVPQEKYEEQIRHIRYWYEESFKLDAEH
jgi:hypothetical protein